MNWNDIWKKHFPHLSPKEAHAEIMQGNHLEHEPVAERPAEMPYFGEFIGE
tara:strand:+ start:262 stop:414 length:153 start_codon:yes stop_codon:yes gene_type:complete